MKKRSRIKATRGEAVYHCISRVVGNYHLWNDREKEVMRKQLWRTAEFSGVEILTYCLMSNHFHVLVRVPDRTEISLTDAELLRRYKLLYPKPSKYESARIDVIEEEALRANGPRGEAIRQRLLARMHDVSEFMKTFKQRFSVWYNRTHQRHGTHWSERFKSVYVENTAHATSTVAAYIDLNPVRAGLVDDPKDYRWCGYAEAVAGKKPARQGLAYTLGARPIPSSAHVSAPLIPEKDIRAALAHYRIMLFGQAASPARGKANAATLSPEQAQAVIVQGGKLPPHTLLRCRVRHFTEGLILGSLDFIQSQLEDRKNRGEISRQSKPRPVPAQTDETLAIAKGIHREKPTLIH